MSMFLKVVLWSNFYPLIFWVYHNWRIPWKNNNAVFRLQISTLVSETFKFEKWVEYANEMTVDVIHSTQYYTDYITRAILANLQCRTLKFSRLIVLQETHLWLLKKLLSHRNSLFSRPHPLDLNLVLTFSLKYVKEGHKLELTYLYACWIMHMNCC